MNLCKEFALRNRMTDSEFWSFVLHGTIEPEPADGDDEWHALYQDPVITKPCGVCGALQHCGLDEEGLPWIHIDQSVRRPDDEEVYSWEIGETD